MPEEDATKPLFFEEGARLYLQHAGRPLVAGGVRPSSLKRYRTVMEKFCAFTKGLGLASWNEVSSRTLEAYAAHLEAEEYAYRSQYTELTTVKQAIGWFTAERYLPATTSIKLRLRKPEGTSTRCWTEAQIQAVLNHCSSHAELRWLGDVVLMMALTGLRISEVRDLRWSDLDLGVEGGLILLKDESWNPRRSGESKRTLKSGRCRSFPIHEKLLVMLNDLKRSDNGAVLGGPRGRRLKPDRVRQRLIDRVLEPLAANAENPEFAAEFRELRPHGLRHFFCSLCANQGVPEQLVMRWLGHSASKMVRHYYHVHDHEAARQMQRLEVAFEYQGAGK